MQRHETEICFMRKVYKLVRMAWVLRSPLHFNGGDLKHTKYH